MRFYEILNESTSGVMYHLTDVDNILSILKTGLKASTNNYGHGIEYKNCVFLTTNIDAIKKEMSKGLYTWSDNKVAVCVDVSNLKLHIDDNVDTPEYEQSEYSYYVEHDIPPENIVGIIDKHGNKISPSDTSAINELVSSERDVASDSFDAEMYHGTFGGNLHFYIDYNGDPRWKVKVDIMTDDDDEEEDIENKTDMANRLEKFRFDPWQLTHDDVLNEFKHFLVIDVGLTNFESDSGDLYKV